MKKRLTLLVAAFVAAFCLVGCGTAKPVASIGKDQAALSFTSASPYAITIELDGNTYNMVTVERRLYAKKGNITKSYENTIIMAPGKHSLKVMDPSGAVIYDKTLYLSEEEHKVIGLDSKLE